MTAEAFVLDAIRTPGGCGRATGSLHSIKPVDLVIGLPYELRRRHPNPDPRAVDDRFIPPRSLVERADAQGAL
jgi:acetyl-CoA C-acetyltransferase